MIIYTHPHDIQFGWQPTFASELRLLEEGERLFWQEQIEISQGFELERRVVAA